MASPAQITANQANAQRAAGPKTESGKLTSKLNSIKHGLTGNTIVLPSEDAQIYESFRAELIASLAPLGAQETLLAQRIADSGWRLNRIPALEANIFALAQLEPIPEHLSCLEESSARAALIEANALFTSERQLRNLHIQEQRLNRELRHLNAQLKELQNARLPSLQQQRQPASVNISFDQCMDGAIEEFPQIEEPEPMDDEPFDPHAFGFDFANVPDSELNSRDRRIRQIYRATVARMRSNP